MYSFDDLVKSDIFFVEENQINLDKKGRVSKLNIDFNRFSNA